MISFWIFEFLCFTIFRSKSTSNASLEPKLASKRGLKSFKIASQMDLMTDNKKAWFCNTLHAFCTLFFGVRLNKSVIYDKSLHQKPNPKIVLPKDRKILPKTLVNGSENPPKWVRRPAETHFQRALGQDTVYRRHSVTCLVGKKRTYGPTSP